MSENTPSKTPIYETDMPARVTNIFQCMGLMYLDEVQLFTYDQLLQVRGMGLKSVKWDIVPALIERGMSLSDKDGQRNEDKVKALKIINEYNNRAASNSMRDMKADEVRRKMTPAAWGLLSRIQSSKHNIECCKMKLREMGFDLDELSLVRDIS